MRSNDPSSHFSVGNERIVRGVFLHQIGANLCSSSDGLFAHLSQLSAHCVELLLENESGYETDYNESQRKLVDWTEIVEPTNRRPILGQISNQFKENESDQSSTNYGRDINFANTFEYDGRVFNKKDVERGAFLVLSTIGALYYCFYYARTRTRR